MIMPLEPFKLSDEQKKLLLGLEADIKVIKLEIERAERVGIDVADLKADYEKAIKLRANILKEYG